MSDKKKPDFLKIIEGCGSIHDQVEQLEKWYEAEKAKADRLEKENQKLKKALESLIDAPDAQCFSEARVRAKEALK